MSSQKVLDGEITPPAPERVYSNQGNPPLIDLLGRGCTRLLDIGCGAGDNAALAKSRYSECDVFGITHSTAEAELAQRHMVRCWVFDIERKLPDDLANQTFDVLIFSHVLEHLREPAVVLARFSRLLCSGGQVLIAVPNVLSWRMRVQFLLGRFEYESAGVLDDTHLRFFTYFTADQHLLAKCPDLELTNKVANGSVPLWWLRRHVFSRTWTEYIDQWGCRHWPNLFGGQVLIRAVKQ
jgi:2-polyprenyl-3-methyl-5-hydroxy-6-metoxy-1,4-benzoquinol methylase